MFDTHCHLNFKVFEKNYPEVIERAREAGVNNIIIPGTDIESSRQAIEIAEKYDGIYAAVGIHPHHVYQYQKSNIKYQKYISNIKNDLEILEELFAHPKVVAIGEVGIDRHIYKNTKYTDYQINNEFIEMQKELFIEQIKLAVKYKKSLIIHNWEAKDDLFDVLSTVYRQPTTINCVFHCCEPDKELLNFAIKHKIFIGVDGDVTYNNPPAGGKQEFIKQVPLDMLVLETDAPYLLPEPLRGQKLYPNEPKNIPLIAEFIAKLKNISSLRLIEVTTNNARRLFQLDK
jgi:TatD DNase family protein